MRKGWLEKVYNTSPAQASFSFLSFLILSTGRSAPVSFLLCFLGNRRETELGVVEASRTLAFSLGRALLPCIPARFRRYFLTLKQLRQKKKKRNKKKVSLYDSVWSFHLFYYLISYNPFFHSRFASLLPPTPNLQNHKKETPTLPTVRTHARTHANIVPQSQYTSHKKDMLGVFQPPIWRVPSPSAIAEFFSRMHGSLRARRPSRG